MHCRHADWRWLSWLVLGNALCIPLGVALLAYVSETPLRLLIGALLLLAGHAAAQRLANWRCSRTPAMRLATGLVSGFVNGVAAIGGIAVAVMLSTTALAPAAMRATMILMFLFTDLYALAWAACAAWATVLRICWAGARCSWRCGLAPAMLAGIWFGQRAFVGVSSEAFRRHVLNLLMLIAALSVLRALWALMA